ncbi:MAG: glycosyltransferase family 39 protein [Planctomycetota bacterium]
MTLPRTSVTHAVLVAALMVVFTARITHVAWTASPTFDEPKHLTTGLAYLASGICCLGRDNTPMVAWNALPLYLTGTLPQLTEADEKTLGDDPTAVLRPRYFAARMMQLPLVWLLCFAVYRWTRTQLGRSGAAIALALLSVEPSVTAFAALVSPDFQVAALLLTTAVAAAPLASQPLAARRVALVGVLAGGALLAKYTALVLVPALVLAALASRHRRHNLVHACAALAIAAAIVLLAYEVPKLTHGISGLHAPQFADRATQARLADLLARAPAADELGYFAGLGEVRRNAMVGFPVYFFGALGHRFAAFYPSLLLFKTPVAVLLCVPLGLICWLRSPHRRGLLVPGLTALLVLLAAITSHFNLGIRHVLLVAPIGSCLAAAALALAPGHVLAKSALIALAALAGYRHHPRHLAYFNELIGGPAHAAEFFADSSIDWGQDVWLLPRAARAAHHPADRLPARHRLAGGVRGVRDGPAARRATAGMVCRLAVAPPRPRQAGLRRLSPR